MILETYRGVVENGIVVLPKQFKFNNGTPVLIVPQVDQENEWLTVKQATKRFGVSAGLVRNWVKSAKVRVNSQNPNLINASDLEDAVEQNELFNLTMQVVEREEQE